MNPYHNYPKNNPEQYYPPDSVYHQNPQCSMCNNQNYPNFPMYNPHCQGINPYQNMPYIMPDENTNANMPYIMPNENMHPNIPHMMPNENMHSSIPHMMPNENMHPYIPHMMPNANLNPSMCPFAQENIYMPQKSNPAYMPFEKWDDNIDYDEDDLKYADPKAAPPLLSNNPCKRNLILYKNLSAYPNYGNPSGNADILYTGNNGIWTFSMPKYFLMESPIKAKLTISMCLDDHSDSPIKKYSAKINFNGTNLHSGPIPNIEHGKPKGSKFTNWLELTFEITNLRHISQLKIINTSKTNPSDWIGIDWLKLETFEY
jgi:hypothetical protein